MKKERISKIDTLLSSVGKIPPNALDIEEVLLGTIISTTNAIDKVESMLSFEMFYSDNHQKIYKVICDLNNNNGQIDILTVTDKLRANGELEEIGGPVTISQLTSRVGSDAHIEYHAKIILQYHILRELIRTCQDIESRGYNADEDVKDLLDELDNKIADLQTIYSQETNTFLTALKETIKDIKDKVHKKFTKKLIKKKIPFIFTGVIKDKHNKIKFIEIILDREERYSNSSIIKKIPKNYSGIKVKVF